MAECLVPIKVGSGGSYKKMNCGKIVHKPFVVRVVPCGKCAFCLQAKRSQWMFRIHHEMRNQNVPGWFLTLTYDEKHVKRVGPQGRLSLRFRDVQLFLKTLRRKGYYAKYVCVGEYGTATKRPHYHMLLWTDCKPETLETLWFRGSIHFGRITMASAMYTLKYIIQPKQQVDDDGMEKTRAQFSKGLGLSYLTNEVYYYHTFDEDKPVLFSVIDGNKVPLPRYYKDKIFTKHQRKVAGWEFSLKRHKEKRIEIKKLRDLGISKPHTYLKNLRVDEARIILKSTKFNQSL